MNKRSIIICLATLAVISVQAFSQWQPIEDLRFPKDIWETLLFYDHRADYIGVVSGHIHYGYEESKIDVHIYDIQESEWECLNSLYKDDIVSLWSIDYDVTTQKYALYLQPYRRLYLLLVGAESSLYDDDNYPDILNIWELKKNGWESINLSNVYYGVLNQPLPRMDFSAAISTDGRIILHGGYYRSWDWSKNYKQTWIFHHDRWRLVEGNGPVHLRGAALTYDEKNKNFVLFSGQALRKKKDGSKKYFVKMETWIFSDVWKKLQINKGPKGRRSAKMFYNHHMEKVVLYGGYSINDNGRKKEVFSDIWTWDGREWELYDDDTKVEGKVLNGPVTFDSNRNRMITLYKNKFWEYKFDKKVK